MKTINFIASFRTELREQKNFTDSIRFLINMNYNHVTDEMSTLASGGSTEGWRRGEERRGG